MHGLESVGDGYGSKINWNRPRRRLCVIETFMMVLLEFGRDGTAIWRQRLRWSGSVEMEVGLAISRAKIARKERIINLLTKTLSKVHLFFNSDRAKLKSIQIFLY